MKLTILALVILATVLTACGGNTATTTTTPTTTTTTTTTDLTQNNNKQVCVGLFNIFSCNTTQVNTQPAHKVPGVPAPVAQGQTAGEMILTLFALLAAFGAALVLGMALLGNRGYN